MAETVTGLLPLEALVDVDGRHRPRAPAAGRDADLGAGALDALGRRPPELLDHVHGLGGPGGPERVALAEEAPGEVHRGRALEPGGAVGRALPALALGLEAEGLDAEGLLDG